MTNEATGADPRTELMRQHAAARANRDAAQLGSEEYRAAAEEVARIEIEIARREEPPIERSADPSGRRPADRRPAE